MKKLLLFIPFLFVYTFSFSQLPEENRQQSDELIKIDLSSYVDGIDLSTKSAKVVPDPLGCPPGSVYCNPPIISVAWGADQNFPQKIFQPFSGVTTPFYSVTFWMVFPNTSIPKTDFLIEVFGPGATPGTLENSKICSLTPILETTYGWYVYKYNAIIPVSSLTEGWISVQAIADSNGNSAFWVNGDPAKGNLMGGGSVPVSTHSASVSMSLGGRTIAFDDNLLVTEDIPEVFNPVQNDITLDNSTLIIIDSTANGNLALTQATGQITYTPNSNYFGNDVLKYSISDGAGDTDTAMVYITVTPVNDAPMLANDTVVDWENVTIEIDVLANDSDIDMDELNLFATKTTREGGSAWVLGNNISYSPPAGFTGSDVIEYEVCDNGSPIKCSKAKVYVTVTEINDLPVVDNEMVVVDEDGAVSGDLTDAGDSDPEGTVLIANITPLVTPTNGVLVIAVDGMFTYTPNPDFFGADMAIVKVCDQGLPVFACVPDTIFITVNSVNDAPVLTPTALTVEEDEPNVMVDISGNVADVENNGLVTSVISGAATFPSMYNMAFSPAPNFNGTEVITYSVCDDAGACDTATVTITVTPVNDPPIVISTFEDIEIQVGEKRDLLLDDLLQLLFDDVDEGDDLTLSVVMANGIPLPAWVTITDGVLTSLPYGGNMGCYDLLFVATDHSGATATEPFTICVVNKNVATAIDDLSEIFEVSLYPNPSKGSVTLELGQSDINGAVVSVYNIAGQKIHNQIYSENRIKLNLENQRSGMYYVKVITGSREVVKKLVLNRE